MTAKFKDNYEELNYCNLDYQCSVYTLAILNLKSGEKKILAAPIRPGNILCIDMQNNLPIVKPVPFTSIPGDCDLVSIDALNQPSRNNKIFIGMSFTKSTESFLNVYTTHGNDDEQDFHLDKLACCCQLKLSFVPFQLYNCHNAGVPLKAVFLLAGLDGKVHSYEETRSKPNTFLESDTSECFPEFANFNGIVTSMRCVNLPHIQKRLTAVGNRDGRCHVFMVDLAKNKVAKSFIHDHDDTITSVTLFTLYPPDPNTGPDPDDYNLLVTTAFEQSTVYRGVFKNGFSHVNALQDSNGFDCCLCGLAADVDLDGVAEIVLGTYGQKLLLYKLQPPSSSRRISNISTTTTTTSMKQRQQVVTMATNNNNNNNNNSSSNNSTSNANVSNYSSGSGGGSVNKIRSQSAVHLASMSMPTSITATKLQATATKLIIAKPQTTTTTATTTTTTTIKPQQTTTSSTTTTTATTTTKPQQQTSTTTTTTTTSSSSTLKSVMSSSSTTSSSNIFQASSSSSASYYLAPEAPNPYSNITAVTATNKNNNSNNVEKNCSNIATNGDNNSDDNNNQLSFQLVESRDFNEPIMALEFVDLTSDSLKELVVMSLKGVHILQKNLNSVMSILKRRLNVQH